MMNFTDIAYITNGTLISLLNSKNKQYVALDSNLNLFKVNGIHPFLINKDYEKENSISSEFYIFQSSSPNKNKNILTFGTQVTLMTKDQMCLVATNNGEVRLEALKGDKTLNSYNLPQNSKFTLIDPFNNNNISKPLLFNDEIILRSTFGSYLILNSFDISMNSNGMIISEETIWKVIKTNTPFIPEWTTKRKYLNFNNISYLFNLEKSLDSKDSKKSQKNDLSNSNLNQSGMINPSDPKDKMSLLTLSSENQERFLLEDLLLVLIGLEGNYIKRSTKKEKGNSSLLLGVNNNDSILDGSKENPNSSNIYKNFTLKFEVEPYLDNPTCAPSLLYMVHKILPLSIYYDRITNFINLNSHIETGLIAKSFCKGLRKIIREYILFINQLEAEFLNDNLDIQKLWYLSQPSLKILENLQKLCYQASLVKGGSLLNIIYSFLQNTTDLELKKLYKFLLDKSIEPYFEMMKFWTCRGLLDDKFEEFMILSNKNFTIENLGEYYHDLFWEKKFILNEINIPEFFSNIAEKIFFIGKSLNILRECEKIIECPFEEEFHNFLNVERGVKNSQIDPNNENINLPQNSVLSKNQDEKNSPSGSIFEAQNLVKFQNLISKIFDWTNETLKSVLFKENHIEMIFKSIKKFYFMECGDFYNHLIDLGDEMLLMERNKINFDKFEIQIENAIRSTSANLDANKDLFSFNLSNMVIRTEKLYLDRFNEILKTNDINSIIIQIRDLNNDKNFFDYEDSRILESLLLNMKVSWPLNLIFSKKTFLKYKILFRQLLILKYQEKKLAETWILQQNFKEFSLQDYLKPSYLLRDKMINFVKNIIYYFFNEVIEPNYLNFINNLLNAKSIDEIINDHEKYLDTLLKECLLDETEILIQINDILQACLIYSKIIIKFYNSAILDEKLVHYQQGNEFLSKKGILSAVEKRKRRIEDQNIALGEIFLGEDKKFLITVEKFRQHFENKLELFLEKINRL
jgi:gamma-tubulin complex component 2